MKTSDDEFVQQYTAEFNQKLKSLAEHQNQAIAMIFNKRIRQELTPPARPVSLRERLAGAYQQVKKQFGSPQQQNSEMAKNPTEEDVVVIDAEYTVSTPITAPPINPTKSKENTHGLFDASRT